MRIATSLRLLLLTFALLGLGGPPESYAATGSDYARNYVQKAYVAYYGRPADPGGQDYWASRMDAEGGSLNAIIGAFGNSAEFNTRYGQLTNTQLVTRIYQQALNRDPDQAGLNYYVGELQAGRRTLQSITLDVLNGATTAPDSTVVANKLDVAAYYTDEVAEGCPYGTEQDGADVLSSVTADLATVTAAKVVIDSRCGLYPLLATPAGSLCTNVVNYDALGEVVFEAFVDPIPHGCLVVDSASQQPVLDGVQSVRFELRPGECNASPASPDCATDRSRYEISEVGAGSTEGKLVVYDLWAYVPPQPRFRPKGGNIMFLNQIQYLHPNYLGGVLAFLEVGVNGELMVRTHVGFSNDILQRYTVAENLTGRWTKVRWEIRSTTQADGFLRVYVDDALKVDETRPTLQTSDMRHALKVGIYNAFRSEAVEPYETQVVYFDGIRRTIE